MSADPQHLRPNLRDDDPEMFSDDPFVRDQVSQLRARIRRMRVASGLTLRDLADRVGIDFTYLSKIENGHDRPSDELVARLDAELRAGGTLIAARAAEPCPRCGAAPTTVGLDELRALNDAARTLIEQLDRHGVGNMALFEQQVAHLRGHLLSDAAREVLGLVG